ncbi:YALI0F20042p [Colletotrichum sp. SAR11_239]|nr:YALI0F20042p [Colletotrichum sp. SAR11_239]
MPREANRASKYRNNPKPQYLNDAKPSQKRRDNHHSATKKAEQLLKQYHQAQKEEEKALMKTNATEFLRQMVSTIPSESDRIKVIRALQVLEVFDDDHV